MAREIIDDHNVVGLELGNKYLSAIGLKPVAIAGAVRHQGGDHRAGAQARNERGGLAVPMGHGHPQPLAFSASTMGARSVGRCPGFVDGDDAVRVKIDLAVKPVLALPQDVGALLLDGVCSLFYA